MPTPQAGTFTSFGAAICAALALLLTTGCATSNDLAQRLADPTRSAADKARDTGRKPSEVIEFLGIKPGMQVLDLVASGGYYTEVLSMAVGPSGKVYAQNPPFLLKFRDGVYDKELSGRLGGGRLSNVERMDVDLRELVIAPGSLDAAFTALNFHDVFNQDSNAAQGFLTLTLGLLKPGGVLGLIDHVGDPDKDNTKLHRIDPKLVRAAVKQAGFEIDSESSLLAVPTDTHDLFVFDPSVQGKTDRFLLRLRKPG